MPTQPDDDDAVVRSAGYLRGLRAENKHYRERQAEMEASVSAALASVQAVKDEAAAAIAAAKAEAETHKTSAQSSADQRIIRAEMKALAAKAGMHDLDGLKLADLTTVTLKDGDVDATAAQAVIDKLKTDKPYLFGSPTGTSSPAPAPAPAPGGPKLAKDLSPEEFKAGLAAFRKAGNR